MNEPIQRKDLITAFLLLAAILIISFKFLNLWFITDDPSCLYASRFDIWKLFFNRDTYLSFNKMFYSPLLPLSFKIDTSLFGLNPSGYHIINLLLVFLTGIIAFRIFNLYLPKMESWIGTYMFVLSYPFVTNIGWITRRHYLAGGFFCLLSFYFFKTSESNNKKLRLLLSLIFYGVALFFKEAFSPMPAVYFALSSGKFYERIKKTSTFFIFLLIFIIFRIYILGGMGGYINESPSAETKEFLLNYLRGIKVYATALWYVWPIFFLPFLIVLFLKPKQGLIIIMLFLILSSPFALLKIPEDVTDYFLFYFPSKLLLPHFVFSFACAYAIFSSKKGIKIFVAVIITVILFLQIRYAPGAYSYIKSKSIYYKTMALSAYEKNMRGKNLIIGSFDSIFYSYFYEFISPDNTSPKGLAITIDNPALIHLFPFMKSNTIDEIFDSTAVWTSPVYSFYGYYIRDDIRKPCVTGSINGNTVSFMITDVRKGLFFATLITEFSSKNISIQSTTIVPLKKINIGLTRDKEKIMIFYCDGNNCSEPAILETGNTGGF